MRILLTNDDGYFSLGIIRLRKILESYGEVFLVAPKKVQSAKGCALTIDSPLMVEKVDQNTYVVDGTQVDCIIFGISNISKIDLIVSGCNNLPNLSNDTIYSGTCAACIQGLMSGYKTIAFSCAGKSYFDQLDKYIPKALEFIFSNNLLSDQYFLNVNFPNVNFEENKGILLTKLYYQKIKYSTSSYKDDEFVSDRKMDWNLRDISYDIGAFNKGYISITPMTGCNFNQDILSLLEGKIK